MGTLKWPLESEMGTGSIASGNRLFKYSRDLFFALTDFKLLMMLPVPPTIPIFYLINGISRFQLLPFLIQEYFVNSLMCVVLKNCFGGNSDFEYCGSVCYMSCAAPIKNIALTYFKLLPLGKEYLYFKTFRLLACSHSVSIEPLSYSLPIQH